MFNIYNISTHCIIYIYQELNTLINIDGTIEITYHQIWAQIKGTLLQLIT